MSSQKITETRNCEHHGEYVAQGTILFPGHAPLWRDCPACDEIRDQEIREREDAEQKEEQRRQINQRIKAAQIPTRYAGKGFDSFFATTPVQRKALGELRAYAENFKQNLADGRCGVLVGGVGTGKTHLACSVCEEIARMGYSCHPSPQQKGNE